MSGFKVGDRVRFRKEFLTYGVGFESEVLGLDGNGDPVIRMPDGTTDTFYQRDLDDLAEIIPSSELASDRILTEQGRWVHINRPVDAPRAELANVSRSTITLRDRFAMAALTGLLGGLTKAQIEHADKSDAVNFSSAAYKLADAMMAERERAK